MLVAKEFVVFQYEQIRFIFIQESTNAKYQCKVPMIPVISNFLQVQN